MPDHASVRDRVASAPWHREPLGSVLPSADSAGWMSLLFAARATTVVTVGILYGLSALLLLTTMSHLPDYAFNWEEYAAADVLAIVDGQRSLSDTFRLTDGLMTDSGRLPWVALPVNLSFGVSDIGMMAFRVPLALLSALAVPLTFLLGRVLAGPGTGVLAAALVAVSPAFLVYGRTATVVGLSVPVALVTALLLLHVIRTGHGSVAGRVAALAGLQVALIAGAYAYSPIRLFWAIALTLIVVELIFQRDHRGWLLSALAVTLLVLPVFLTLMLGLGQSGGATTWDLRGAVSSYYHAGGEQLATLVEYPATFRSFLPAEAATAGTGDLVRTLLERNVSALLNLLADRDTQPALTDYWNTRGQLYSRLLVPAAVIGGVLLLSQLWRSVEARFLVLGLAGLTLPLLATSQVHLGRLVFASPFLLIIAALGIVWLSGVLIVHLPNLALRLARNDRGPATGSLSSFRNLIQIGLALVILIAVAAQAWTADRVIPPPSQSAAPAVVAAIRGQRDAGVPAVAMVLTAPTERGFERLDIATYRLILDDEARFVDVSPAGVTATGRTADRTISVYYGSFLGDGAGRVANLPGDGCEVVYLIAGSQAGAFQSTLDELSRRCSESPGTVIVPGF